MVVAGGELVEARFLPVMIDDYRPVAVTGEVAERIVRLHRRPFGAPAESERIEALQVGAVLVETQPPGMEPATVRFERNSGVVELDRAVGHLRRRRRRHRAGDAPAVPPAARRRAPRRRRVRRSTCSDGAGSTTTPPTAIAVRRCTGSPPSRPIAGRSCRVRPTIPTTTRSSSSPTPTSRSSTRFVARVGVAEHRLYDTDDGRPADAPPSYTISLDARRERGEEPELRLVVYTVDDEDPTSDPESTVIRDVEIPLPVADGDGWTPITIELPADVFAPVDGKTADAALLYVVTPPAFRGLLAIDNVRIYEWRGVPPTEHRDVDRGRRDPRHRARHVPHHRVGLLTSIR